MTFINNAKTILRLPLLLVLIKSSLSQLFYTKKYRNGSFNLNIDYFSLALTHQPKPSLKVFCKKPWKLLNFSHKKYLEKGKISCLVSIKKGTRFEGLFQVIPVCFARV